jgi:hypothetical protein
MSFVREHIANKNLLDGEDIEKIELEFKRFVKLALVDDGPLAVIDPRVDEFWHCFVLFTPQYNAFCLKVLGFFLHHQPRTTSTEVSLKAIPNFVRAYEQCYGELDHFWLEHIPPYVKEEIAGGRVPREFGMWSGWPGREGR